MDYIGILVGLIIIIINLERRITYCILDYSSLTCDKHADPIIFHGHVFTTVFMYIHIDKILILSSVEYIYVIMEYPVVYDVIKL